MYFEKWGFKKLCINVKNESDQFEWAFTGIYGPNLNRKHQFIWEELAGLNSWWNLPWCLRGDLNVIHFPLERLEMGSSTCCMNDFSDFISLHVLTDNPLEGGLYTWSNSNSTSRIDWFLFSLVLVEYFTHFSQKRLRRVLSDHFPILLESRSHQRAQIPFRLRICGWNRRGF